MEKGNSGDGVRTKQELTPEEVLFGTSAHGRELQLRLKVAADSDVPVLLEGESGVGKEAAARWLHFLSRYANAPLVKVTCRAGDFDEVNRLREHRGAASLFFEELENLGPQARLRLRQILEEHRTTAEIVSLQGVALADLRVICSTRQQLDAKRAAEMFGNVADSVLTAKILPLRERREELMRLARHFIALHSGRFGLERADPSSETLQAIERYRWPGNLHELDEMMTSYVLTGDEGLLREKIDALRRSTEGRTASEVWLDPPPGLEGLVVAKPLAGSHQFALEDEMILRALRENCWNRRQTASRLQISYRSLLNRLKKIDREKNVTGFGIAASRG